ncbi:hypothetical protein A6V29_03245 [Blastococcus sp. CCUG 61487]|nr:hypothetical protein A6V29_03245 [Blastococcus sp. CCUG 61487]
MAATLATLLLAACSEEVGAPEPEPPSVTADADPGSYLALGDSVPFGFRPAGPADYADPADFVGYPELVGAELGLEVLTTACPGETTATFLDPTEPDMGCHGAEGYRTRFPTHVPYASPEQSQLELALDLLEEHDDVELITLQLGANDAGVCHTSPGGCADPVEQEAMTTAAQGNLDRILRTLRDQGGYDGRIVVVTYYALDYPGEPAGIGVDLAGVPASHGAEVVDGYEAFRERALAAGGSSVAAGLVIPDDIHPTDEGQRLLAAAVLAVVG